MPRKFFFFPRLLGMEVHWMSSRTLLHSGWWVLCESHQDVGDCKNMRATVSRGLALKRGPSLRDSAWGCHREQGSIGGAECSKVSRGMRRPAAATAGQEELDAGVVTSLLGSVCTEVPAVLEGVCRSLQGVQPVLSWDEGPSDVFPSAQVSPSPLEQIYSQSHLETQPLSSEEPYHNQLHSSYCPVLGNP